MTKTPLTAAEMETARRVYLETRSQTQAADAAGRARVTIRDYLRREGLLRSEVGSLTTPKVQPQVQSDFNEGVAAYIEWCKEQGRPVPRLPGYEAVTETIEPEPEPVGVVVRAPKLYRRVVVLSDIHLPYHDKLCTRVALDFIADYKPDLVVLNGDILDCYEISDHQKDPTRAKTLQDEFDESRWFFTDLNRHAADVVYIQGNHEQRLERLIANNRGLAKMRALEWAKAAELPTRWKVYRDQTHYHNGGFMWLHGNLRGRVQSGGLNPARALASKLRTALGAGHFHRESLNVERQYNGSQIVSYSQGHLSDLEIAGGYVRWPDWQTGFSVVEFSEGGDAWPYLLRFNNGRLVFGREYAL